MQYAAPLQRIRRDRRAADFVDFVASAFEVTPTEGERHRSGSSQHIGQRFICDVAVDLQEASELHETAHRMFGVASRRVHVGDCLPISAAGEGEHTVRHREMETRGSIPRQDKSLTPIKARFLVFAPPESCWAAYFPSTIRVGRHLCRDLISLQPHSRRGFLKQRTKRLNRLAGNATDSNSASLRRHQRARYRMSAALQPRHVPDACRRSGVLDGNPTFGLHDLSVG